MPRQEQALARVLLRCRLLYSCALQQCTTWWGRGQGIGATDAQQATELPELKAACPDYREVPAPVAQDVLRRVEKTNQAFFRRRANGENASQTRFQGQNRSHSFT